jgi:hypothetical protein
VLSTEKIVYNYLIIIIIIIIIIMSVKISGFLFITIIFARKHSCLQSHSLTAPLSLNGHDRRCVFMYT